MFLSRKYKGYHCSEAHKQKWNPILKEDIVKFQSINKKIKNLN